MWSSGLHIGRRVVVSSVAATAGGSWALCEAPKSDVQARAVHTKRTASGYAPERRFRVGVLGATGAVGQRFLQHLEGHPWFEVTHLGASERSAGKTYGEATAWHLSADAPAYLKGMRVAACEPAAFAHDVDFVFSALDTPVAAIVEPAFRDAGVPVFSNASKFRMTRDVPLVVPQVNGDHLGMVKTQPSFGTSGGYIVTNANCSTTGMVIALAPLEAAFGIAAVHATTMQAISGAGYPGVPSLDILDNVVPFISGEEEKLESEYAKIMGSLTPGTTDIAHPGFPISAQANRVHVRDGHCIALSVKLRKPATPEQVVAALRAWAPKGKDILSLPSAPAAFIEVRDEPNRPQPRLDRESGDGYTTVVGRVRACPVHDIKLFVLSHNTVMGAAGSSILNAELAATMGLIKHRK